MLNERETFETNEDLAAILERAASSIRGRASRTSASSQRIMSAEAAAYERVARMLRAHNGGDFWGVVRSINSSLDTEA